MKKLLSIALVVAFTVSLAGCGDTKKTESKAGTTAATTKTETK